MKTIKPNTIYVHTVSGRQFTLTRHDGRKLVELEDDRRQKFVITARALFKHYAEV